MAHPRKIIRHAVVALLTGVTAAGDRVFSTRVEPLKKRPLPSLSVYALGEPVRDGGSNTAPRELTRDVRVEIAGWVAHSDSLSVDDAMDDLAEQIEAAMDADPYLAGAAGDSILESTEMEVSNDGDRLIGIVALTYSVTYYTSPAAPANLDDFERAGVTIALPTIADANIDVPATDPNDNSAKDLVDIPIE